MRHSLWFGQDRNPNQFPKSLASTAGRMHRGVQGENSLGFPPWELGTVCSHIWAPGWPCVCVCVRAGLTAQLPAGMAVFARFQSSQRALAWRLV